MSSYMWLLFQKIKERGDTARKCRWWRDFACCHGPFGMCVCVCVCVCVSYVQPCVLRVRPLLNKATMSPWHAFIKVFVASFEKEREQERLCRDMCPYMALYVPSYVSTYVAFIK